MYDEATYHAEHFHVPEGIAQPESMEAWIQQRREILRDWGRKRERKMHRRPWFIMDQMISGSGLYPLRLLDTSWFTPKELTMISRLEHLLQDTGHAHTLAYDMLTPLIYDIEVAIVLDNSGSMNMDMFGQMPPAACWLQFRHTYPTPSLSISAGAWRLAVRALQFALRLRAGTLAAQAWHRTAPFVEAVGPSQMSSIAL
ncbi:unnamed protein product [Symbiodinium necroappetens]|uniref:Uncharacterized protein n=1 Tax=Symbiodinium necroappetens TaxID=1628268 RepID=A0A812YTX9_9DINO|nr:unnamed protein product [Symbiodinium necroappetens]